MLCDRLQAIRKQIGMSLETVSDRSEVPLSTVTKIFRGITPRPQFQNVVDICTAMGVSVEVLLYPDAGSEIDFKHPSQTPLDERMIQQYERLLSEKERLLSERDELLASKDRRIEDKVRALRHKDMWIKILAIAFGTLLALVFAALIIDVANHNAGWFRT